jgi:hypothetical protein
MSARSFDIGKSKKFGNIRITNSPNEIIVTLHQTNVVVYDKNKGSIRLTSGGWQTPTTKTAINNALTQLEYMLGMDFPRISQVKGQWYLGDMEFKDGITWAKRKIKKNPSSMTKDSFIKRYNNLLKQAESLPRVEAIKKLEQASKLKAEFYSKKTKSNPRMRRNPESRAKELYNSIIKEFNSDKHYSWDVFDYRDGEIEIEDYVDALKSGEDVGTDNYQLLDGVADMASENANYWVKENAEEEFEELEDLDSELAFDLRDEMRFKYEELANYNWKFPSPLFVTDPNSLEGYRSGSKYYSEDNYLAGPYNAGKEAKNELKKVIKLGMKHGFSKADCEEVYLNSQGGTLGIAIITDESEELYEAVMRDESISIGGTCVLYIHDGMNGSGHYVEKGNHTIKVKKARELINMIDYGSYSLGDVFGTRDWKY